MKIRKGFVSNSSSSSFICEVCGEVETGYDMSYDEAGFMMCEHGHVLCQSHIKPITIDKAKVLLEKIKSDIKYASDDFLEKEEADQLQELIDINVASLNCSSFQDYGYDELPEEICPICSLEAISDSDILTYILKEHNSTRQFVIEKAKKEFGTYGKFVESLK